MIYYLSQHLLHRASPRSIIAAGVQTKWFCCIRGISQVIGQANKDSPIEASRYLAASDFSTSPHSPKAFFFELPSPPLSSNGGERDTIYFPLSLPPTRDSKAATRESERYFLSASQYRPGKYTPPSCTVHCTPAEQVFHPRHQTKKQTRFYTSLRQVDGCHERWMRWIRRERVNIPSPMFIDAP